MLRQNELTCSSVPTLSPCLTLVDACWIGPTCRRTRAGLVGPTLTPSWAPQGHKHDVKFSPHNVNSFRRRMVRLIKLINQNHPIHIKL